MKLIIAVPAISALVYRAWSRKSLTPAGILTALATAVAHAVHPWSVFFALLATFFLAGTAVTKVKHNVKARLTQSATGASGGEGPRNHVQVLANSLTASILILLHTWVLSQGPRSKYFSTEHCWRRGSDILVVGIVANYAAVAADTFSSELGILSSSKPRLITAPWRVVPPGTNGGVTAAGLIAGLSGSFLISAVSAVLIPWCNPTPPSLTQKLSGAARLSAQLEGSWSLSEKVQYTLAMTIAGFCGTILDSLLGALLQASVVDVHSGRIIEGDGGRKVLIQGGDTTHERKRAELRSAVIKNEEGLDAVAKTSAIASPKSSKTAKGKSSKDISDVAEGHSQDSRRVDVGRDILDNNAVNLLMAAAVSVGSMVAAALIWDVPLDLASIVS